jgi:hypothetical protein
MSFLIVAPAKAGAHNHRAELSTSMASQEKATNSVLTNFGHGVWVPAFAGTTW